jgi:Tfp pilus assembly protein PilO
MQRSDVLAMVEDQFTDIRQSLNVQLVRMGQIQQQLDQIQAAIRQLIKQDPSN